MLQHAIQIVAGKFQESKDLQLIINLIYTATTNYGKPIIGQTKWIGDEPCYWCCVKMCSRGIQDV